MDWDKSKILTKWFSNLAVSYKKRDDLLVVLIITLMAYTRFDNNST